MGMRFRKSVKICKGVRVNFSKSGASVSLGGRGHSVNVSKRGTRATVGIPGSGLSYSTMISSSSNSSKGGTSKSTGKKASGEINVHMNDDGSVVFTAADGREIIDQAYIRKIKATQQYKDLKEELNRKRLNNIEKQVQIAAAENAKFINIYQLSAKVDPRWVFENKYREMQPEVYVEQKYDISVPTEESIRSELESEAEESVQASIFKVKKLRRQYVEERLESRLAEAVSSWENEKHDFERNESEKKMVSDQAFREEYEENKAFMRNLLDGESDAVCDVFDEWIASCELPVEINIDYDWNEETRTMMLDVDLPEIEDLSETMLTTTASGNLKEKKKTQKELRGEYATLVFGLAVFISSHTYNITPAIKNILISGYTQRRDREGNLADEYVYSIKFTRDMFEKKKVSGMEPIKFCMEAENRCNMTTTSLLKKIKPYDEF